MKPISSASTFHSRSGDGIRRPTRTNRTLQQGAELDAPPEKARNDRGAVAAKAPGRRSQRLEPREAVPWTISGLPRRIKEDALEEQQPPITAVCRT